MASDGPSFSFSVLWEDIAEALGGQLGQLDEAGRRAVTEVFALLTNRDIDIENYLTGTLAGQRKSEAITAVAGGAQITFGRVFAYTPVVIVGMGDSAAGKTANVVDASVTTTGFQVQVFNGAVEVVAGTFRINWFAS